MDLGGVARIFIILGGATFLAFVGTVIELVKIYRQHAPEKVRRAGTYFILKVVVHAGAALAGGFISTIYFMYTIDKELRQLSLLLLLVPVVVYYRVKWRQLKDSKWYTYAWFDLPMLALSTLVAAFVFNLIIHHF